MVGLESILGLLLAQMRDHHGKNKFGGIKLLNMSSKPDKNKKNVAISICYLK